MDPPKSAEDEAENYECVGCCICKVDSTFKVSGGLRCDEMKRRV